MDTKLRIKKFFYFIEFVLIKLFFLILKIIGYKSGSNLGCFIGRLLGPIFRSRKLINKNLEQSGVVDKTKYNKIVNKLYGNYGRILAEYPFLKEFRNNKLNNFIEICSEKRGELKTEIRSAKNLSNDEINNIKDELSKHFTSKIKLDYKYDESLIGGLIVQVGSTMIDTSIKNKLQQIENKMMKA